MTDNEIIKELNLRIDNFSREALDLINRQKADIERLNIELTAMRGAANSYKSEVERLEDEVNRLRDYCDDYGKFVDEPRIKSEAIKEFAEMLKEKYGTDSCIVIISKNDIDDLVKEMTEVSE